jgi:hypothetical protein
MTTDLPRSIGEHLLYVCLISAEAPIDYEPVLPAEHVDVVGGTLPHQMDRGVAAALPGLWYLLHLPRRLLDLVDLPLGLLDVLEDFRVPHSVLLVPADLPDVAENIRRFRPNHRPALVVSPDGLADEARRVSTELGAVLEAAPASALSNELLQHHWRALHDALISDRPFVGAPPTLVTRLDTAAAELPVRALTQRLGSPLTEPDDPSKTELHWLATCLNARQWMRAAGRLEREEIPVEEAEALIPERLAEVGGDVRVPVSVGLTGTAPPYASELRRASGGPPQLRIGRHDPRDTLDVDIADRADDLVERATVELLLTHNASRGGFGLMAGDVPTQAFLTLANLERHWHIQPRPHKVRALLRSLDRHAAPIWTDAMRAALASASQVTAFTNFPFGLLTVPGDTSPLACRLPLAYRPLSPLTRATQMELDPRGIDLTAGLRVLVAECIPTIDPVGRLSRSAWDVASQAVDTGDLGNSRLVRVDVNSARELQVAVAEHQPNILVLSAHGMATPLGTAVAIGDRLCWAADLGDMPPLVILSACDVAPRGRGHVSIADLLLRQGATAILGTQIPVDVRRNSMLTLRFFINLAAAIAGETTHQTVLEVWHHTQASNAVNDILYGSPTLEAWGHEIVPSTGEPVLREFMGRRASGSLRYGDIYRDTEALLGVIADEMGVGARMRGLIRDPGYIPESLLYSMIGRPEQIFLRDPGADRWERSGQTPPSPPPERRTWA